MGVRQNPWTPTKRRGPIAAETASPGPAVVSLPSLIGKVNFISEIFKFHTHSIKLAKLFDTNFFF